MNGPLTIGDALYHEIEAAAGETARQIAEDHAQALTEAAAAAEPRRNARYRLWTCPVCWTRVFAPQAPDGWLIVQPFTRVAACLNCRGRFDVE